MKLLKELLSDLLLAIAHTTVLVLVLFPPVLSSDELKVIIGLPLVILLSFFLGCCITEREHFKRRNKREFEKKKALCSGNYNKAHYNKNYNKSLPR